MIDETSRYGQFKLTSGHEIVCEIIDWPAINEVEIVIRNVLMITIIEHEGKRNFMFRPFLQYCESEDDYVVLNINSIMTMNKPNVLLINDYLSACTQMRDTLRRRMKAFSKNDNKSDSSLRTVDSDDNNVVIFPNTFH